MKNVRKICFYAKQMRNVCVVIEDCAADSWQSPDEGDDPISVQLMLDQLEQAQHLILGLTQSVMDAVDYSDVYKNDGKAGQAGPADSNSEVGGKWKSENNADPVRKTDIPDEKKEAT